MRKFPGPGLSRRGLIGAAGLAAVTLVAKRRGLAAAAPGTVNVGFFTETKPTMIAKAQGWFDDGVKARIAWTEMGSGAEINTAIAAGSCDFGLAIGSSPTAAGISQSLPYQLIGMVDNIGPAEEMTVRTSANIRTAADFRSKKVATPFGSTSHFRLLGFLKTNNLTERDVTVLDMRPDAIVAAWTRGDIDAAYVWSPAKAKLLAAGGETFRTYDNLDAAGYVIADLIVVRNGFAEQYPDAVIGFLRAYGRALQMWRTTPQEAADIVAKQAGVDVATALADMKEYDFVTQQDQLSPAWLGVAGNPGKFVEVLKRTADFLVEQRSIRAAPGPEAFAKATNTSYLAKALG
jgi:taurine transport system substrate-binding protein